MGSNDLSNGHGAMLPKSSALGFDPAAAHPGEIDLGAAPYTFGGAPDNALAGWESAWIDLGGEG
jgi:hypothetical protein